MQRGLRAFKKSFQSAERLRRSRTGPGISLGARSRATKPADGYPEAGLKIGALSRACAARLRRTSVRRAPAPYVRAHVPRPSRKLSVARRRTLVVFAGSVYLRDLRPPPAGAEAPREPGPEV